MRGKAIGLAAGLIAVWLPKSSVAQDAFPPPIGVRIPLAPAPVAAMGHTYLAYELHLSSLAPVDYGLTSIDVFFDGDSSPFVSYRAAELAALRLDPTGKAAATGILPAGGFDVIFLWLELAPGLSPRSIRNVINVKTGDAAAVTEAKVDVRPTTDVSVLGPPLRGGPWVMAHGPANPNGHRRSIITLGGRPSVVQRYGVDYFKVDSAGHVFAGDTTRKQAYYAYGQEVLAVTDAVVAATQDGIAENETHPFKRGVPLTLRTIGGNYVVLDIGQGRYVFYAHLQPGSLRVRKGDKVKRGQVLGLLGLSGNTPSPHLHLHVGDTTEPIGSEGLPYVYEAFEVVGECPGPNEMWGWYQQCTFTGPSSRTREIPLAWQLIRFKP